MLLQLSLKIKLEIKRNYKINNIKIDNMKKVNILPLKWVSTSNNSFTWFFTAANTPSNILKHSLKKKKVKFHENLCLFEPKFFVNLRGWKGIQTDGRWCHRVILKGITKILVILYTMLLMYLKGLDTLEATLHTHSLTIKIIKIIHFVFVYYNSLYLNMFQYLSIFFSCN